MPRKKVEKVDTKVKTVQVFDQNRLVREYSEEVHGEDFKLLAEMFATKNNFIIKHD